MRFHRGLWLLLCGAAALVMVYGYVSSDLMQRSVSPQFEIGTFLLSVGSAAASARLLRQ